MTKNKKITLITLVLVLILGVLVLSQLGGNQEEKLTIKLEKVGSEFYSEFYYDQIVSDKTEEEVEAFLARYSEIGIKVDIDNLSRFNEEKYANLVDEFKNKKDDIACDIRNTRAIIYPTEPFGKTDFTVSAELDCGFEAATE